MRIIFTILATVAISMAGTAGYGQVAYSEDFESVTTPALPGTWTQNTQAVTGWKTHSGSIASTAGWVMPAHTKAAVLDDWNNDEKNNPSTLISPVFDMSALTTPYLAFEYYFVAAQYSSGGMQQEKFTVEISTNGTTWTQIGGTIAGNSAEWQKKFIDLSAYKGETTVQIAFKYSDEGTKLIGVGVDDIKVFDPAANDIEVVNVTPADDDLTNYGAVGSNINFGGTIFNNGSSPITGFTLKYQVDAGPVVTNNITGINVAPFTTYNFTASTAYNVAAPLGGKNVQVWAELAGDANAVNDSGKTKVHAVSFMPPKKLLAEEGTGAWCGWCPRGHVYMDSIANNHYKNSFSLVAVHNGDPMVIPAYDAKLGSMIGGYPSMMVDRRVEADPSELIDIYNEQKDYFGFAEITLTDVPVGGFNYSLKVSVKPAVNLNGDYRLALVLTEDDVRGDNSAWNQRNYYNATEANQPLKGAGFDWQKEGKYVTYEKMFYNHVARMIVPGPDGASGSLPASMAAGTTYDYTFTTTIPSYMHRENMHAVVMLIRNSDGHVLNSNNLVVPVGITDVAAGINEFTVYPNPAYNYARVNFTLEEKATVKLVITDAVGRTLHIAQPQEMTGGMHSLQVDLSAFSTGVYNVTLQTGKGNISTRLSVVK